MSRYLGHGHDSEGDNDNDDDNGGQYGIDVGHGATMLDAHARQSRSTMPGRDGIT